MTSLVQQIRERPLKRHEIEDVGRGWQSRFEMVPYDNGDWVRFEEVNPLLQQAADRIEELEAALQPFAYFGVQFATKPIGSLRNKPLPDHHVLYGIHFGDEDEAQITCGHVRAAVRVLGDSPKGER